MVEKFIEILVCLESTTCRNIEIIQFILRHDEVAVAFKYNIGMKVDLFKNSHKYCFIILLLYKLSLE